jgi:hypothetical protein
LNTFLRHNAVFAVFWLLVVLAIMLVLFADQFHSQYFYSVPLAIAGGVSVWLTLMFCFSRGWISEGD